MGFGLQRNQNFVIAIEHIETQHFVRSLLHCQRYKTLLVTELELEGCPLFDFEMVACLVIEAGRGRSDSPVMDPDSYQQHRPGFLVVAGELTLKAESEVDTVPDSELLPEEEVLQMRLQLKNEQKMMVGLIPNKIQHSVLVVVEMFWDQSTTPKALLKSNAPRAQNPYLRSHFYDS